MSTAEQFVQACLAEAGDRYVYGAEVAPGTPASATRAWDCSELVQVKCNELGVPMVDGSANQMRWCQARGTLVDVDRAIGTRGALLFRTPNGRPGHVAVSLGDGRTIEARGSAYGTGVFSARGRTWTHAGLIAGLDYGGGAPAPAPGPVDDYWTGMFSRGSRGQGVAHMQANLAKFGYDVGAIDGDFGPKTEAALRAFQRDARIEVDGVFGPQSRAAMEDRYYGRGAWAPAPTPPPAPGPAVPPFPGTVRRGDRGESVRQVQQRLADRGWHIDVDGIFGPQTERVVTQFQAEKGLVVDGIAGPQTWHALWTVPVT